MMFPQRVHTTALIGDGLFSSLIFSGKGVTTKPLPSRKFLTYFHSREAPSAPQAGHGGSVGLGWSGCIILGGAPSLFLY